MMSKLYPLVVIVTAFHKGMLISSIGKFLHI